MTLESVAACVGIISGLVAILTAVFAASKSFRFGLTVRWSWVLVACGLGTAIASALMSSTPVKIVNDLSPVIPQQNWTASVQGVRSLQLSPSGRALGCASEDSITLWNVASGEQLYRLTEARAVASLAFSPEEQGLFTGDEDGMIRLWSLTDGTSQRQFSGHRAAVTALLVHPDGRRLISAGWDGTVRVWELDTGRERLRWDGLGAHLTCLALKPGGRILLVGCGDGCIREWDLATGTLQQTFSGHTAAVRCLTLTADGRQIITGSDDTTVRVWELTTGQESTRWTGHSSGIRAVRQSPKGAGIQAIDQDGTVLEWRNREATPGRYPSVFPNLTQAIFTGRSPALLIATTDTLNLRILPP